jgi:hypothetical protein
MAAPAFSAWGIFSRYDVQVVVIEAVVPGNYQFAAVVFIDEKHELPLERTASGRSAVGWLRCNTSS